MNNLSSFEDSLLNPSRERLSAAVNGLPREIQEEAYYRVLEATAAEFGGFNYRWYKSTNPFSESNISFNEADPAMEVAEIISRLAIPPALALSSLAIPQLNHSMRRWMGAYHTDFRLALHVAMKLVWDWRNNFPRIVDPSAGTGILLSAAVLSLAGDNHTRRNKLLKEGVFGADVSHQSIRGCSLALASLTSSASVIEAIRQNLFVQDSLLGNMEKSLFDQYGGMDFVIGNPPWEKLKLTRHEYLLGQGTVRHYGQRYEGNEDLLGLNEAKKTRDLYSKRLREVYHLARGESDTYMFFVELSFRLAKQDGGKVILILPAGLIRSSGTFRLRRRIFDQSGGVSIDLLFNRANFFAIDTRTKFIILSATKNGRKRRSIGLHHCEGENVGVVKKSTVSIQYRMFKRLRPDLTLPEIRSQYEWNMFQKLVNKGSPINLLDEDFRPSFMREVDMTQDRAVFRKSHANGKLPVIEGRMVHQYRHNSKRYISGSGRRAVWKVSAPSDVGLSPQFWIGMKDLPERVKHRVSSIRLGFCDIAGQTNERTMLAAEIPSGMVCGNKVPTLCFPRLPHAEQRRMRLFWLTVFNSFIFDWMLRRICTTTVNYHFILSLPLPRFAGEDDNRLDQISSLGQKISRRCKTIGRGYLVNTWKSGEIRALLDCAVAEMYGLDFDEVKTVMNDFPLLGRGQPILPGENRCYVTRDLFLLRYAEANPDEIPNNLLTTLRDRVTEYKLLGASPYVPSHLRYNPEENES